MIDLSVKVAGIKMKNPVMPAAGPTSRDGETLLKAARGGAGCLVAKTVSVKPAPVPRPNMMVIDKGEIPVYEYFTAGNKVRKITKSTVKIGQAFSNTELWTEKSLNEWCDKEYKIARKSELPLICSVGYTPDDMKIVIPKVVKSAHPDGIEFSTHYVKPGIITDIIKTIKKYYNGPVFAKLSPHDPATLVEQAKEAERAGADGIVAINSLGPTLHFDIDKCKPILGSQFGFGWMSGTPIKPIAVRCVFDIAKNVKIPVLGVGGISSGKDVIEMMMAGASAVQICTAAILEGTKIYGRITKEISDWLSAHKYKSLKDITGLYIKKIGKGQKVIIEGGLAEVDEKLCKGCHLCETVCVYEAISFENTDNIHEVSKTDKNKCYACGLCTTVCPTGAREVMWK